MTFLLQPLVVQILMLLDCAMLKAFEDCVRVVAVHVVCNNKMFLTTVLCFWI